MNKKKLIFYVLIMNEILVSGRWLRWRYGICIRTSRIVLTRIRINRIHLVGPIRLYIYLLIWCRVCNASCYSISRLNSIMILLGKAGSTADYNTKDYNDWYDPYYEFLSKKRWSWFYSVIFFFIHKRFTCFRLYRNSC